MANLSQVVGPDTGEQSPEEGRRIKKNKSDCNRTWFTSLIVCVGSTSTSEGAVSIESEMSVFSAIYEKKMFEIYLMSWKKKNISCEHYVEFKLSS